MTIIKEYVVLYIFILIFPVFFKLLTFTNTGYKSLNILVLYIIPYAA